MTADASDVLPCCGVAAGVSKSSVADSVGTVRRTPLSKLISRLSGTRQQDRHVIIGYVPKGGRSAFCRHDLL